MTLGRVCASGLLAFTAATTLATTATAASAASVSSASVRHGGSYGPIEPQDVTGKTSSRVDAHCKDGAATGSVPVSVSFNQAGRASAWTARGASGDLVAQGPGSVAVFGVKVDCRHPQPVVGHVYFDVTPSSGQSVDGAPVATAATKPVGFYVNVLPADGQRGDHLSAPLLTGGAAIVLACLGVLGALRRVRSLTRGRSHTSLGQS